MELGYLRHRTWSYMYQYYTIVIISRVFCPRAGPSLQAQEPRLQFCEREVFHRKLRNQGCSFTRDWMGAVASTCFPHPTLSLASEQIIKDPRDTNVDCSNKKEQCRSLYTVNNGQIYWTSICIAFNLILSCSYWKSFYYKVLLCNVTLVDTGFYSLPSFHHHRHHHPIYITVHAIIQQSP